jgi:hypothetical protein
VTSQIDSPQGVPGWLLRRFELRLLSRPFASLLPNKLLYLFALDTSGKVVRIFIEPPGVTPRVLSFGTPSPGAGSAIAAATLDVDRQLVMLRGADSKLFWGILNKDTWGGWQSLDGILALSAPTMLPIGRDDAYCFIVDSDHAVQARRWTASKWGSWIKLNEYACSAPDVIYRNGKAVVAWQDAKSWLQVRAYTGLQSSTLQLDSKAAVSGEIHSQPSLLVDASGALEAFAVNGLSNLIRSVNLNDWKILQTSLL